MNEIQKSLRKYSKTEKRNRWRFWNLFDEILANENVLFQLFFKEKIKDYTLGAHKFTDLQKLFWKLHLFLKRIFEIFGSKQKSY